MWLSFHPRLAARTLAADPRTPVLLSERQFGRALHRERQRADRCQAQIALIRLELAPRNSGPEARPEEALEPVFRRVRAIDELGWVEPGVVGILLPDTDGEGAWTLLGDLLEADRTGLLRSCRTSVYAYPERLPEDIRPVRGARPANGAPRETGEPTHAG